MMTLDWQLARCKNKACGHEFVRRPVKNLLPCMKCGQPMGVYQLAIARPIGDLESLAFPSARELERRKDQTIHYSEQLLEQRLRRLERQMGVSGAQLELAKENTP